tara:strand:+ start:1334 stop:1975 length:642 start_codon:yes stop_codon:yes gene_type:complete
MLDKSSLDYRHINWGPYVLLTTIPDYITDRMLEEGRKCKDTANHKLAGHLKFQFSYSTEIQQWFYNEITPVLELYIEEHCKFHGLEVKKRELEAMDLWVNFMKKGDFNPPHTHAGDYSFVYYLDVPDELQKEQEDYKGSDVAGPGAITVLHGESTRPKWTTCAHGLNPKKGAFMMFPALLQHTVAPFKSDITRVSVSGNLRTLNSEIYGNDYF